MHVRTCLFVLTLWGVSPPTQGRKYFRSVFNLYYDYLLPASCGIVKVPPQKVAGERILGGIDAEIGEMPWIAILGYKKRGQKGKSCN